jgi:hypothetical protein
VSRIARESQREPNRATRRRRQAPRRVAAPRGEVGEVRCGTTTTLVEEVKGGAGPRRRCWLLVVKMALGRASRAEDEEAEEQTAAPGRRAPAVPRWWRWGPPLRPLRQGEGEVCHRVGVSSARRFPGGCCAAE